MRKTIYLIAALVGLAQASLAQWPQPKAPVIPETDGYILIPNAAVRPEKSHVYKVIFDATGFSTSPHEILPAINNLGSELNALEVEEVPKEGRKFAIVFHGPAIDGILTDSLYKSKFGTSNPNLKVISKLKAEGVRLFVCGQNLAALKLGADAVSSDVAVASDALIVLIRYQNDGYAVLSF